MKISTILFAVLFSASAFAQSVGLPKIAVYVTGDLGESEKRALGTEMLSALVKSGRYVAVERSAAFVAEIEKEHVTQRSGAIDDSQISALGKQFGARYICAADVAAAFGSHQMSARVLDVETAEVVLIGKAAGTLNSMKALESISAAVVDNMFASDKTSKPAAVATPAKARDAKSASPLSAGFKEKTVGLEMSPVQGGTFRMGCTSEQGNECSSNERPVRGVTVGDFYIGKYEVTRKQWVNVMGKSTAHKTSDNKPIVNVSWTEVQEFISTLNQMTGKRYRLPTEAEWEYAARGGSRSKGYMFSGSNDLYDVAWNRGNCVFLQSVGGKKSNELGLYDMSGNAAEWVGDWFGPYSSTDEVNPVGHNIGSGRVNRGGCVTSDAKEHRVSNRENLAPDTKNGCLGFRLALDP